MKSFVGVTDNEEEMVQGKGLKAQGDHILLGIGYQ
jgi:hypothetical protein